MKNIGNILIFNGFDKIQFSLRFVENQYSIPVSSTKKVGASRLFLCLGRESDNFAVLVSGSRAVSWCVRMGTAAGWRFAAG